MKASIWCIVFWRVPIRRVVIWTILWEYSPKIGRYCVCHKNLGSSTKVNTSNICMHTFFCRGPHASVKAICCRPRYWDIAPLVIWSNAAPCLLAYESGLSMLTCFKPFCCRWITIHDLLYVFVPLLARFSFYQKTTATNAGQDYMGRDFDDAW